MTHTCVEATLRHHPLARPEVIRAFQESARKDDLPVWDARGRRYEHH